MKICTKCNLLLEASYFVKDKTKSDGLYSSCKDCYRIRTGSKKRRPPWSIDSCGYRFYKKERLHRKIMEDKLGRKLSTNEHVHHINHNKLDNR